LFPEIGNEGILYTHTMKTKHTLIEVEAWLPQEILSAHTLMKWKLD